MSFAEEFPVVLLLLSGSLWAYKIKLKHNSRNSDRTRNTRHTGDQDKYE